ncbi:hypothetical protein BKH46_08900 [Helicobacter sp. 12S02634-8]|uniref:phage protease n=1 Tax=Helicobacter sp. 12S02634-8 TaxID=1476199 RepID=UPI000BA63CA6|nr:phage protease [Helicobacter sp. 12S02634-8]PAF46117.1 hypothetical protein BKH46_08900 [Helicobacter sp. 12S02634-8]
MDLEKENIFLELNFRNESQGESIAKEVKILPVGKEIQGIDGRKFAVDGEEVLEALKKEPADLMLDLNHDSKGEAMGWFKNPKLKEDGIYAELEPTPKGKELIDNKLYRYLSPAIFVQKEGDVAKAVRIHSVGLVNQPNLGGLALNSQESFKEEKPNQNKGKTMATDQKEEALKDVIEKKEQELTELKNQLEALNKEKEKLSKEKEQLSKEKEALAKEKEVLEKNARIQRVEQAILLGELLPKRKEEVLELNSSELDKHLEIYKIEAQNTLKTSALKDNKINPAPTTEDALSLEIKRQLGLGAKTEII